MMGALAGLAIGLGLIFLLEYRDTTIKTGGDVGASLALPVIAVIPVMTTLLERERQKRQRVAIVAASCAVGVLFVVAAVWRPQLLDNLPLLQSWVR